MRHWLTWACFLMLALVFLIVILGFPLNEYEWMLEDQDLEMARAALPIDLEASTYPFFAGAPVLLLGSFVFLGRTRKERLIVLAVMGVLFVIWLIKFRSLLFGM